MSTGGRGARVSANDIIFFNGVADAVSKVYGFLSAHARVIGPSPAYSTHSSAESAHCALPHITYDLDPENGWMPDLADLRRKIQTYPSIAGILIINPNNPTGAVYPPEVLEEIVALAREFGLFLIADEIYIHMVFPGVKTAHLSEIATDVPAIVMRGISKELPWPGSRCGWIEVLNRSRDQNFSAYVDTVVAAKRLEVCSTSGPQLTVPRIFGDPRYAGHLEERARMFAARADEAYEALRVVPGLRVNPAQGAFYMTALFEPRRAGGRQPPAHREPGTQGDRRAAVRGCGPRRPLRLSPARLDGHLRGAAERVLLAASRLPLHPARDRRRQAGLGLPDPGRGGDGLHRERLQQLGEGRIPSPPAARGEGRIPSPPAARKSLRDSSPGRHAALPFMSSSEGRAQQLRRTARRTPLAARRRSPR